ncbi:MAG: imidazoleglycerol-phosphate dehydratase HisB [Clostridiales bacterium]|nr:imidazoleglycerol-phosphate dehydratase HisB [Clostridiales bacterium]
MREATVNRITNETDIKLTLRLDCDNVKQRKVTVDTGCGFFDHMLTLFAAHGGFGLDVTCKGDTHVDFHHSAEDIGICLGQAFSSALGDCAGIRRYGSIILPMDEALVLCAVDVSGRGFLSYETPRLNERIGNFDTELAREFFTSFTRKSMMTLHIKVLSGENTHHILEAIFKAAGRAVSAATELDNRRTGEIQSTKGII